jgi:hypothetical protein
VPPDSSHDVPSTSWDTATVSKTGPMILEGFAKSQGSKAKPISRVRATQSNQSEGRSDTKGDQQLFDPQASYLSPDWEVSCMPLYVGWHRAIWVFPSGITRERCLKPPAPNLTGGISPYLSLWRDTCPDWLSPANGHPGSTQILTWHYSA